MKRNTRLDGGGACVQRVFHKLLYCASQVQHHLRRARALAGRISTSPASSHLVRTRLAGADAVHRASIYRPNACAGPLSRFHRARRRGSGYVPRQRSLGACVRARVQGTTGSFSAFPSLSRVM